jgi:hypothetical protein
MMDEQETITSDVTPDSESQQDLHEWVTPTVEEFTLKEALANPIDFQPNDSGSGSS